MDQEKDRFLFEESVDSMLAELNNELDQKTASAAPSAKEKLSFAPVPSDRVSLETTAREKRDTRNAIYRDLEREFVQTAAPQATAEEAEDEDIKIVPSDDEEDITIYPAPAEEDMKQATRVISEKEIERQKEQTDGRHSTAEDAHTPKKGGKNKKKKNEAVGCLKSIIYVAVVLIVSSLLAYIGYVGLVDVTGLGRSTMAIDVTIPDGASTQEVASILAEENIIQQPWIFRIYCRLTNADGTFHPGVHTLSANLGYTGVVDELQTVEERATVTVTITEGSTVDDIATLMEKNSVCSADDFYTAIVTGNYDDYDFIAELTAEERQDRIYLLEGYLFPDTYEFYVNGAAETAVRTMLDGFDSRVNADTRATIKASGKTLNEIIIEASIAQKEAGKNDDMPRVARVLLNRLSNTAEFPCLQLDSTEDYLLDLLPTVSGVSVVGSAYNTYERPGLPVGAICNPGLAAINAVLNPSEEPEIINCYYFASIVETGESAFFETFDEHEAWCVEHGVGMYGN